MATNGTRTERPLAPVTSTKSCPTRAQYDVVPATVDQVDEAALARVRDPAQRRAEAEPGHRRPRHLGDGPRRRAVDHADRPGTDDPVLTRAVEQAPAGADPLQDARDPAHATELEGQLGVERGHQPAGQGHGGVLRSCCGRPGRGRARRRRAPRPAARGRRGPRTAAPPSSRTDPACPDPPTAIDPVETPLRSLVKRL